MAICLFVCLSNVTHPRLGLCVCLYATSFTPVSVEVSVKCDPLSSMSVCLTVCQMGPTLIMFMSICLSVCLPVKCDPPLPEKK